MDAARRRLAERRLLAALRRMHRAEPMRQSFRIDTVLAELRGDPGERLPASHRGAGSLRDVADPELVEIVDALADRGELARDGRRLRLTGHQPGIADNGARDRIERLLDALRAAGARPPRAGDVAARLGIAPGLLDQLRSAGELVPVGDGIDYPADVLVDLQGRLSELARTGPLSPARVRDALATSRRHAQALLRDRDRRGVR